MKTGLMGKKTTTMYIRARMTISINKLFNQSKRRGMKSKIFALAVIGCMAGIFLAGCEKTSEQKFEGAKQDWKDAKADYLAEREKFKIESEEQIKANDDRIDAFQAKMEKAGTKTKAEYKIAVAELKQKNRDLKKKLEEYKDEGESKWQEFKTNFNRDMDSVGKTMKDLFKDKD
jgi:transketolase